MKEQEKLNAFVRCHVDTLAETADSQTIHSDRARTRIAQFTEGVYMGFIFFEYLHHPPSAFPIILPSTLTLCFLRMDPSSQQL